MSHRRDNFYLSLIFAGTIISLSPLFFLHYKKFHIDVVNPHTVVPATFLVILIPLSDLLLDFVSRLISYLYPDQRARNKQIESSVVIRLTDIERLIFIVGVAIQSAVYFVPHTADLSTISIVNSCSNNCSVLFCLGPIATFLQRCTTTFTHLRTSALIITLLIGLLFYTISYHFRYDSQTFNVLVSMGRIFAGSTCVLFVFTTFLCAKGYIAEKLGTPDKRIIVRRLLRRLLGLSTKDVYPIDTTTKKMDNDDELYTNYIPAMHMLSIIIIGIANISVEFNYTVDQATALVIRNYITLTAQIMVLVIELRIRKNEIARGLVSLVAASI